MPLPRPAGDAVGVVLGACGVGTAALAVILWVSGDYTGSLAALTAMGTFALASVAVLTYGQNRALVRAATDEAAASRDSVEEMRREREWAYRPHLVVRRGYSETRSDRGGLPVRYELFFIRNLGTGPALNVRFGAHTFTGDPPAHRWLSWENPGIAPGGEEQVARRYGPNPHDARPDRYRCLVDQWQVSKDEEVFAVRYEDWFGTHYRASGGTAVEPQVLEWRGHPSLADAPDWLRCQ